MAELPSGSRIEGMFDEGWGDFDAAATLDAAVEFDAEENRAALGKVQAAQHFAALHGELPTASSTASELRGRERLKVYGGEGCPAIAEFAPAEWGALMKLSTDGAAAYLGEALALPHRFPRIWAKALDGQVIVWRARMVARACLKLSQEAAALVDERVVGVIDTVTSYRLHKLIEAVIKEADPEAAHKAAEEQARERGVWIQQSDLHGTKTIYVKAAAGDVICFDATIDDLAWALHVTGDPDPLEARRAKAIGWIADPAAAYELLTAARYLAGKPATHGTTPSPNPDSASRDSVSRDADSVEELEHGDSDRIGLHEVRAAVAMAADDAKGFSLHSRSTLAERLALIKQSAYATGIGAPGNGGRGPGRVVVYVHLTDQTLSSGEGIIRVENYGPLLAGQLKELLGHHQVIVKPVIDLNRQVDVNSYEIPARIRERVRLAQPVDRFPFGAAETTPSSDLDHVKPYDPHGPPGQTSTGNLAPSTRFHHRVKTHGRWQVQAVEEGALQWTSPNGFRFLVDYRGTRRIIE